MELKLTGIRKHFGEKEVLRGCGFTFQQGKIYGLLGRNGAGKTTLFNCLTDEVPPDGGTAELVLDDGTRRALAPDDVGYVFATPILPDFLTGYEFVRFYMDVNAARIRDGRSADDYFDMVQIAPEDRHRLIKGYSHGMKNKVQMLCFLIARPPVILLDEPLTSFDVVVACGTVRHRDNGIVGASAERFIREFRVDYGIIGISGIDEEGNLLDYDYREVAVARTIIECSRRVFLVTDRSKFGRPAMVRVAHLSDINALFTDGPVDKKWADLIHEHGVELFMV